MLHVNSRHFSSNSNIHMYFNNNNNQAYGQATAPKWFLLFNVRSRCVHLIRITKSPSPPVYSCAHIRRTIYALIIKTARMLYCCATQCIVVNQNKWRTAQISLVRHLCRCPLFFSSMSVCLCVSVAVNCC